jgi:hypothetical protein
MDLNQAANEGSGLAFTLGKRIARELLKHSIRRKLRVVLRREVEMAVAQHLKELERPPLPGLTQIVIGEVYNVAERVDGVVRLGDELHLEDGVVSLDAVAIDDPLLAVLMQRARAQLDAIESGAAAERTGPSTTTAEDPTSEKASPPGRPAFDSRQRLSYDSAQAYRDRLDRAADEDRIR